MTCATDSRRGHSLIEVLVALVLFEVGLVAVLGLAAAATRLSDATVRLEGALTVAESIADSLLAVGYTGPGERSTPFGVAEWGPSVDAPVEVTVAGEPDGASDPEGRSPTVRLLLEPRGLSTPTGGAR